MSDPEFHCFRCHAPLQVEEVVPLFRQGCCGFVAACTACAEAAAGGTREKENGGADASR